MMAKRAASIFCAFLVTSCCMPGQTRPIAGPADLGANLPARPIGPGDLLAISVYGAPELSRAVRVSEEGTIRLPLLQRVIPARGASPDEMERRIGAALGEEGILVAPAVAVTMAQYASRPIRVAGAVRHPLTFEATGPVTLLEALTRAEGLSPEAGAEILVTQEAITHKIPVKNLIQTADPAVNLILNGGEDVRVPAAGRVFVVGNVKRPGTFAVGESGGTSVLQALALAEGLAPFSAKQSYIYRPGDSGKSDAAKQEIAVPLRQILDRKAPDVALMAGDILYIPDNRRGRVTASVVEKAVSFAVGTASGAVILGVNH